MAHFVQIQSIGVMGLSSDPIGTYVHAQVIQQVTRTDTDVSDPSSPYTEEIFESAT